MKWAKQQHTTITMHSFYLQMRQWLHQHSGWQILWGNHRSAILRRKHFLKTESKSGLHHKEENETRKEFQSERWERVQTKDEQLWRFGTKIVEIFHKNRFCFCHNCDKSQYSITSQSWNKNFEVELRFSSHKLSQLLRCSTKIFHS